VLGHEALVQAASSGPDAGDRSVGRKDEMMYKPTPIQMAESAMLNAGK
jgi:hypothetical protein